MLDHQHGTQCLAARAHTYGAQICCTHPPTRARARVAPAAARQSEMNEGERLHHALGGGDLAEGDARDLGRDTGNGRSLGR